MTEQEVNKLLAKLPVLKAEIAKVIVGQAAVLDEVLVALLAGGHALLEGVPGVAKTLLVRTLAAATDLPFRRIQFTPDLMPTDILGTEVLEEDHGTGRRSFKFNPGPIFASLVLADEINRTPPKTQAALLEAMQEGHVTYAGTEHALPQPFFLLATQNPIEQSGTYPLPEAQLDRFLLYVRIGYPTAEEELAVLRGTTGTAGQAVAPVLSGADIRQLQMLVRQVSLSPELLDFVNRLVRATRPATSAVKFIKDYGRWGAGPRAGQALILCAKARALLHGRFAATLEDIRTLAPPVLRHRVLLNFNAEAENLTADDAVAALLQAVPV
ncbi:MoxR family ATPase [Hymenobacter sp. BT664]|uniref:MoxR family ATPase n=1 Tax=Hymenobacter montanus TaxID=2771359 RepID=A0A927GIU5_9BACT|nr:MoxR family ATPase [Hymenobacter montanus]MBD2767725.1 MoxR family ATPase [Hymenobacter montanus]